MTADGAYGGRIQLVALQQLVNAGGGKCGPMVTGLAGTHQLVIRAGAQTQQLLFKLIGDDEANGIQAFCLLLIWIKPRKSYVDTIQAGA
ncbi:hypothetical protein NBRC116187_35330 [Halopseudomonas sabulinigri]|uniref:Uncharacterized protein n=1 Tax=Halopseudomonas sabulinigri TaxID=472181 RepID=A0ABP9ZUN1_9GAMM